MCQNLPNLPKPAVLLWHKLIQSLSYRCGNQGFFILLQKSNMFFKICGNTVNLGPFFVDKICDSLLLCYIKEGITKCSKIILIKWTIVLLPAFLSRNQVQNSSDNKAQYKNLLLYSSDVLMSSTPLLKDAFPCKFSTIYD